METHRLGVRGARALIFGVTMDTAVLVNKCCSTDSVFAFH